jgi:glutamate--cysteine ligase
MPDEPVTHEILIRHMHSGCKPCGGYLVGIEYERLPVRPDGHAFSFTEEDGVESSLEALGAEIPWAHFHEGGHLLGLHGPDGAVTLEPGAQLEFSTAPRSTLTEAANDLRGHLERLMSVSAKSARWLGLGMHPLSGLDEVPWIPRERYRIMSRRLRAKGDLAHLMMKLTAGVQVNLDFCGDEEASSMFRAAQGVTSLVTALLANSPVSNGRPNGWKSYRTHIWTRTDPDRCGLIPQAFEGDGMTLDAWLEHALDIPVLFIVREGHYLEVVNKTFRQFMERGFGNWRATLDDWKLHLTTIFPEERYKTYLEVRGADSCSLDRTVACAALWKGLLYSADARAAAWELVRDLKWEERLELHDACAQDGLEGRVGRLRVLELAREVVAIAEQGLRDPARIAPEKDEERYLAPMQEIAAEGVCPAVRTLELWQGENGPARLVEEASGL